MKKLTRKTFPFLILVSFFVLPLFVFAQEADSVTAAPTSRNLLEKMSIVAKQGGYQTDTSIASTPIIIGVAIRAVLSFVGLIFIVLMILAGFKWMTAQGNEEQVTKAKTTIRNSLIGLVIVISAWSIWSLIFNRIILMK
jgi:hypothetical protein